MNDRPDPDPIWLRWLWVPIVVGDMFAAVGVCVVTWALLYLCGL